MNAPSINAVDATHGVVVDRDGPRRSTRGARLRTATLVPPTPRGYSWRRVARPPRDGPAEADFPPDLAPIGVRPAPLTPAGADQLGLEG